MLRNVHSRIIENNCNIIEVFTKKGVYFLGDVAITFNAYLGQLLKE